MQLKCIEIHRMMILRMAGQIRQEIVSLGEINLKISNPFSWHPRQQAKRHSVLVFF